VAGHLENGVDGLLLGGVDEGTGVDDEDFGFFRMGGEAGAGAIEQTHHHLGVHEVFGAAQGDEAHGGGRRWGIFGHFSHCTEMERTLDFPGNPALRFRPLFALENWLCC